MRYYKLVGQTPVPVASLSEWQDYLRSADHQIAETIVGDAKISTNFLGFDLNFGEPPLLFETMVLGGPHHGRMQRYSTWSQAVKGHDATVIEVIRANASKVYVMTTEIENQRKNQYFWLDLFSKAQSDR